MALHARNERATLHFTGGDAILPCGHVIPEGGKARQIEIDDDHTLVVCPECGHGNLNWCLLVQKSQPTAGTVNLIQRVVRTARSDHWGRQWQQGCTIGGLAIILAFILAEVLPRL